MTPWVWELDGWIVVAGMLCAASATLLGNFLVLQKLSLLGDAISHAVLPGLAVAFLVTGSRSQVAMAIGAVLAGVLTAVLTELTRRHGRVDEDAALGVIFTSFFAIGLLLIVQVADRIDLDPSCVLHGVIEAAPLDRTPILGWRVPRTVQTLSCLLLINSVFVWSCWKELKWVAFDPGHAAAHGFRTQWLSQAFMVLVAVTTVACFESVGSILVVAMLIVPAATARLLVSRLEALLPLSVAIAATSAAAGHWSAINVPTWFGYSSTTTAGMMAVVSGIIFSLALVASILWRVVPRPLSRRIANAA